MAGCKRTGIAAGPQEVAKLVCGTARMVGFRPVIGSKMELAVTVSVQICSPPPLVRWEHFSSSSEEPCCSVPALDRVEERRTIRDRRGRNQPNLPGPLHPGVRRDQRTNAPATGGIASAPLTGAKR